MSERKDGQPKRTRSDAHFAQCDNPLCRKQFRIAPNRIKRYTGRWTYCCFECYSTHKALTAVARRWTPDYEVRFRDGATVPGVPAKDMRRFCMAVARALKEYELAEEQEQMKERLRIESPEST